MAARHLATAMLYKYSFILISLISHEQLCSCLAVNNIKIMMLLLNSLPQQI